MKKYIFILIQFFICSASTFAQTTWTNYNSTNGLYTNSALVATSDKFNNMWIGIGSGSMGDGLDKFNGAIWTHFDNTNSGLPENDIRCLKADSAGNLWISYYGGMGPSITGLTKFDGTSWTVYDTTNSAILSNWIDDIQIDEQNNLWISCLGGISKFDGTTFTNYILPFHGSLAIEDSANIWIGVTGYGLHHFNPLTNTVTIYDQSNSSIPSNSISCIDIDTNGIIWLGFSWAFNGGIGVGGTNGGLATFNGTTFTTIWPLANPYTGVYGLTIDASNNIWVATRCEGLYKFDGISWTNISGVPLSGCSYCVTTDNSNFVWYTEYYTGVWTNNPTVGISTPSNVDEVTVFPNPVIESFTIRNNFQNNQILMLTNSMGQGVLRVSILNSPNEINIDTRNFPTGIYYWRLLNKDQCVHSGKIIVSKD